MTSSFAFLRPLVTICFLSIFGVAQAQSLEDMFKAVKSNDASTVERLLQRGIDANSTDTRGDTLLMQASREGHEEIVVRLIAARAKINARNASDESALMLAALKGYLPIVTRLQAAGAEMNHSGWNPLLYAAFEGKTPRVQIFTGKGRGYRCTCTERRHGIDACFPSRTSGNGQVIALGARQSAYQDRRWPDCAEVGG